MYQTRQNLGRLYFATVDQSYVRLPSGANYIADHSPERHQSANPCRFRRDYIMANPIRELLTRKAAAHAPADVADRVVVFQSGAYGYSASPLGFLGHPYPLEGSSALRRFTRGVVYAPGKAATHSPPALPNPAACSRNNLR